MDGFVCGGLDPQISGFRDFYLTSHQIHAQIISFKNLQARISQSIVRGLIARVNMNLLFIFFSCKFIYILHFMNWASLQFFVTISVAYIIADCLLSNGFCCCFSYSNMKSQPVLQISAIFNIS